MRIGLFWRTFLLIGGLVILSQAATLQSLRALEHAPPEQQIAWEVTAIVNLTRSALISSDGARRAMLLDELAREEHVRVAPLEPGDRVEALPDPEDTRRLESLLRTSLGPDTRIAGKVDGESGLWVSFNIDDDPYWLGMDLERWTRRFGPPWWQIASLALAVSLVGALVISRLVNRPLAVLSRALSSLGAGNTPRRLPENGPSEIAALNQRFNRMAADLGALESDRALALAGISHDIRTPLTRLRMEIELSDLDEAEKSAMNDDIERIDEIVGKFVDYARIGATGERDPSRMQEVDVPALIQAIAEASAGRPDSPGPLITVDIADNLRWRGDPVDLERILGNLLSNAIRYGHLPGQDARITVRAQRAVDRLIIAVRDEGPGVPEAERHRLLRPFARLDQARSASAGGSGLGLAIVARLASRYRGHCEIRNREAGGLDVTVELPDAGPA